MNAKEFKENFYHQTPESPGVYKFFDKNQELLYIGKAINLKKRVSSYFTNKRQYAYRITLFTAKISNIEFIVVDSEQDALLLEDALVKEHQPKYNIQLKDDKSYPYICIKKERFPRIFLTRNIAQDGSKYYGPYTSVKSAKTLLALIRKLFPIRTCNFNLSEKNITKHKFKVCLEYHIKNCKGPCEGHQSIDNYNSDIKNIELILKGKLNLVKKILKEEIQKHSAVYNYEEAQFFNEKLLKLEKYQSYSTIVNPRIKELDIFYPLLLNDNIIISYLMIIDGAIINTQLVTYKYSISDPINDQLTHIIEEIRSKFESTSNEIVLPNEFSVDLDLKLTHPISGDKRKLLDLASKNAHVVKHKQPKSEIGQKLNSRLEEVQKALSIRSIPRIIECFDNSNFQGSSPVASMVCFKDLRPYKKAYRKFNIKSVEGPDDFASMQEIVYRRYSKEPIPDLIVIDGGKGQLNAALEGLKKADHALEAISIIGIAKKQELIFFPGRKEGLQLNKDSDTLKVIMQIRDEAHRFAITHHRSKRAKESIKSSLDGIPGIGPSTVKKLLTEFGSIRKIKKSDYKKIEHLIGAQKANKIITWFTSKN